MAIMELHALGSKLPQPRHRPPLVSASLAHSSTRTVSPCWPPLALEMSLEQAIAPPACRSFSAPSRQRPQTAPVRLPARQGGSLAGELCVLPHRHSLEAEAEAEAEQQLLRVGEAKRSPGADEDESFIHGFDELQDWTPEQLDAIACLFQGTPKGLTPMVSRKKDKQRPLPLPTPYKLRPLGFPKSRRFLRNTPALRLASNPSLVTRPAKDKNFLYELACHINSLPNDQNVSSLLDKWVGSLIRGSLSATIRELGRFKNPQRAFEVFFWQEEHPHLWPDERTLGAIIEVLAETGWTKDAWRLQNSLGQKSSKAFEALARGFVRAGNLNQALQVKEAAEQAGTALDHSVYAKIIILASRRKETRNLVFTLVEQLGRFAELKMKLEDCAAVMTACSKVGLHEAVESLFRWWKMSGFLPNVVMYSIFMLSLSKAGKHREALAVYWEMEEVGCPLDLPAYKIGICLCAETGDASRGLQLFTQMKQEGFSPTIDMYNHLIKLCCKEGRVGKAKELLKEIKLLGLAKAAELEDYMA